MVACRGESVLYTAAEARRVAEGLERATHDDPRNDDGRFNFDVRWVTGVETALDPVNNRYDEVREVATACRSRR